ncbi:MAG: hypothetical protein Q9191_002996 [Dirinaria sp. TL-2023a]
MSDRQVKVAPTSSSRLSSICSHDGNDNLARLKLQCKNELSEASVQTFRRVKFIKRTGNGHYCDLSDDSNEFEVSPSVPTVYARIIEVHGRHPQIGNQLPKPSLALKGTPVEKPKNTAPTTWEDAVAEANRLFEVWGDNFEVAETPIRRRRIVKAQVFSESSAANTSSMTRLTGEDACSDVPPIPMNFFRQRSLRTPSIHSGRSELDCNSPLFGKSVKAAVEKAHHNLRRQKLDAASLKKLEIENLPIDNRVKKWLQHVVSGRDAPDVRDGQDLHSGLGRRAFNIWTDEGRSDRKLKGRGIIFKPDEEKQLARAIKGRGIIFGPDQEKRLARAIKGRGVIFEPEDVAKIWDHSSIDELVMSSADATRSTAQALKDVTNLRQPGYLKQNSFFRDLPKPSHDAHLHPLSVVRGPPPPLQSMATPDSRAGVVHSPHSQAAASYAALAKLEGRARNSWETIPDSDAPRPSNARAGPSRSRLAFLQRPNNPTPERGSSYYQRTGYDE